MAPTTISTWSRGNPVWLPSTLCGCPQPCVVARYAGYRVTQVGATLAVAPNPLWSPVRVFSWPALVSVEQGNREGCPYTIFYGEVTFLDFDRLLFTVYRLLFLIPHRHRPGDFDRGPGAADRGNGRLPWQAGIRHLQTRRHPPQTHRPLQTAPFRLETQG